MRQIHKLEIQKKEKKTKTIKKKQKDHCSSSSTTFDWIAGVGNDSSWFGDVRHNSNCIVSFSWFGLLAICCCCCSIGVKNDEDVGDELWIDGKVESN